MLTGQLGEVGAAAQIGQELLSFAPSVLFEDDRLALFFGKLGDGRVVQIDGRDANFLVVVLVLIVVLPDVFVGDFDVAAHVLQVGLRQKIHFIELKLGLVGLLLLEARFLGQMGERVQIAERFEEGPVVHVLRLLLELGRDALANVGDVFGGVVVTVDGDDDRILGVGGLLRLVGRLRAKAGGDSAKNSHSQEQLFCFHRFIRQSSTWDRPACSERRGP